MEIGHETTTLYGYITYIDNEVVVAVVVDNKQYQEIIEIDRNVFKQDIEINDGFKMTINTSYEKIEQQIPSEEDAQKVLKEAREKFPDIEEY